MTDVKILGSATAENKGGIYKTFLSSRNHLYTADEPKEFGGNEDGPAPTDYLCMALSSCKAITMRMYARRKGWQLEAVKVRTTFTKGDQMQNTFVCNVSLTGDLSEEQVKRILEISKACPVDRLLGKPSDIVTTIESV